MGPKPKSLHWIDWVVFSTTLVISTGIGIFFACSGGKQKTTNEYLVADRKLSLIPTSISMFMSLVSAIFILGNTAEVYFHGAQLFTGQISALIGYIISAFIFVPIFYRLKVISSYEYISMRFGTERSGRILRLLCVIIAIVFGITNIGLTIYAPATAMEAVTGFPLWANVILIGVVTTFYTTLGGIKAVVWTDAFQGIVVFTGLIAIFIAGTAKIGGFSNVWQLAGEGHRLNFFNFNPDPTVRMTFWSLLVGRLLFYVMVATAQNNVQRYCALPTLQQAKVSVILMGLIHFISLGVVVISALVIFAYFHQKGCDPLRGGKIANQNQILPYFIVNVLDYPGLPGAFFAVLFSGAFSTISSSLNALSAITWEDLIKRYFSHLQEERKALVTKVTVFIYGILAILFTFAVPYFPGHILQVCIRILTSLMSPVVGVLALGVLTGYANSLGCSVGVVAGIIATNIINIGAYITSPHVTYISTAVHNCTFSGNSTAIRIPPIDPPPGTIFPLFRLSFLLISSVGFLTTITIATVISILSGGERKERRDSRYITPVTYYCCCCCPGSVKENLMCGVTEQNKDEQPPQNAIYEKSTDIFSLQDKEVHQGETVNSGRESDINTYNKTTYL